jgi:hypothetical protein
MAPVLVDYHQKRTNLLSKILQNEAERIQLDGKLRSLSNVDSRLKQRQQIDHIIQTQRAKQRN